MTFKAKSIKRPRPIFEGERGLFNILSLCMWIFPQNLKKKKKKADKNVFRNLTSEILELSRLIFN